MLTYFLIAVFSYTQLVRKTLVAIFTLFVAAVDVRGRPGSFHSKHKYNNPGER